MSPTRDILVVDDDLDILETIELVLSAAGYTVKTATNGKAALHALRTQSPPPGLVLLDLMMPIMNGWEFRAEQVEDPVLAQVPVVIFSGMGGVRDKAAAMGITEFLEKPVNARVLLELVARYCA